MQEVKGETEAPPVVGETETEAGATPGAAADAKTDAAPQDEARSRRVYVGNLPWGVSWQDLKDLMKTTGHEVTRSDVMQTPDGRSKGCGIVEFATVEGANQAVLTLNDTELRGRRIFVREDREDFRSGSSAPRAGGDAQGHRFSQGEQAQSRRVYVGNLSWDVDWPQLKDHMRAAGEVVHAEVICEHNGRSKGCGIVEYQTEAEAQQAISTLTHSELNGRTIFVREDRETSSAPGATGGGAAGGAPASHHHHVPAPAPAPASSVYVWNLSFETSWQDLKDHMRAAGQVESATILTNPDGRSMGCGIVVFATPADAAKAIAELNNSELNQRQIHLREDRAQSGGRGGGGRSHRPGPKKRGPAGGPPSGTPVPEGTQLFVGNLSFDSNWRELKDLFKQCGEVERATVGRGFGTVRFQKKEDAQAAIEKFNGTSLRGRTITVRVDQKV
eukprot:Nitzschia sp. Nitz4//scaffold230_size58257//7416//8750//NITZ4_006473-RA/size58257-processed-gene-0.48-mRNA-1//1//CDS//3329543226//4918//frame0